MLVAASPILLVEDSRDDVLLMQRAFRLAKIANPLAVVGDGQAAVDYLAGEAACADRDRHPLPLVVLLDLKLPRKSGLEVLEWLKAQPGLRRLPVVVFTSSQEHPDVTRAYDLGANSYLVKPVHFQDLQEMVRALHFYWVILNAPPDFRAEA